jgi:Helix-turn-helix of DDE superfamily endonuclease
MKWTSVKKLKDKDFRRMVGVKRSTFEQMLLVISDYVALHRKHPKRGRPPKLTVEDKLLMMLMYYREYRTFFHTAGSYDISEGQCFRIIVKLENILIQSGLFSLPGKKALLPSEHDWEVVLIDVSESSVERPKKNSGAIIQEKRKDIL